MSSPSGHLRIVPNDPEPQTAPGGGRGGGSSAGGGTGHGGGGGFDGWVIVDNAVAHVHGVPRQFEVAGWREQHYVPVAGVCAAVGIAPDWFCERAQPDRAAQLAHYVGCGARHVWLLDQAARTIDAYRLEGHGWRRVATARDHGRLRAEPFEHITLDLSSLWTV